MKVTTLGSVVTYRSRRRWPGPVGAGCEVVVDVGTPFLDHELTEFDHWLTARFRLYYSGPRGIGFALAEHAPWRLHRARALHLDTTLIAAAGLPQPATPPLVHWSPGTAVRVGLPHRLVADPARMHERVRVTPGR